MIPIKVTPKIFTNKIIVRKIISITLNPGGVVILLILKGKHDDHGKEIQ